VARTRRRPSRRLRRPRWTIAVLVLASITIITLDYRGSLHGGINGLRRGAHDVFSPIQSGVDSVFRPIGSFFAGAVHYQDVQTENAKLRAQLGRDQREMLARQSQLNELAQLIKLDKLSNALAIPPVTAQVTAQSTSDFSNTVDLDKGSADGVGKGMPVVGGAGLVGTVIEVWKHGCTVQLINDTSSAVSVRYGREGATAIVSGQGDDVALDVDYVPLGQKLPKGTLFTTSGLQHDLFPPSIPVAVVESSSASSSAAFETVTARPLADLDNLEFVDVLQWYPPPVPAGS